MPFRDDITEPLAPQLPPQAPGPDERQPTRDQIAKAKEALEHPSWWRRYNPFTIIYHFVDEKFFPAAQDTNKTKAVDKANAGKVEKAKSADKKQAAKETGTLGSKEIDEDLLPGKKEIGLAIGSTIAMIAATTYPLARGLCRAIVTCQSGSNGCSYSR